MIDEERLRKVFPFYPDDYFEAKKKLSTKTTSLLLPLLKEKEEQRIEQTKVLEELDFKTYDYEKKIADINGKDIGNRIKFKVQIQSISDIKQVPLKNTFACVHCGEFKTTNNDIIKDFADLLQKPKYRHIPGLCLCGRTDFNLLETVYGNCYSLEVIDPLSSFDSDKEIKKNRHPRTVYFVTEKLFDFTRGIIEFVGDMILIGKTEVKKPAILAQTVKPLDEYFTNYQPTEEDQEQFKKHFKVEIKEQLEDLIMRVNQTIAPLIVGRSNAKFLAAIAQHSPLYQNKKELGICRVMFAGDSRCGKSEIGRDVAMNLSPLGAEYVIAETASRTGISYAIDDTATGERIIRWGVLPQCDGGLATLDGLHAWDKDSIMQLRETLVQGIVQVNRVLKGQTDARVRLIGITNLEQNVCMYATRFLATRGSQILGDVDRNRWDWIYVFGQDDVGYEQITSSHTKYEKGLLNRAIPKNVWKKHVAWAWNIKPEQLVFPNEVDDELERITNEFLGEFNQYQSKPFSNEFCKIYRKFVLATHVLTHSFEDGKIKPSKLIIEFVRDFFKNLLLDNLEFNDVMRLEAEQDEQLETSKQTVLSSANLTRIFKELVVNRVQKQSVLIEKLQMKKSHVSEYCAQLEGLGLIKKIQRGIFATESGMKLYRQIKGIYEKSSNEGELKKSNTLESLAITELKGESNVLLEHPRKEERRYSGISGSKVVSKEEDNSNDKNKLGDYSEKSEKEGKGDIGGSITHVEVPTIRNEDYLALKTKILIKLIKEPTQISIETDELNKVMIKMTDNDLLVFNKETDQYNLTPKGREEYYKYFKKTE